MNVVKALWNWFRLALPGDGERGYAFGPAYAAYRRRVLRPAPDPVVTWPYRCKGGPFDRRTLFLQSPGTLSFSGGRYEVGDKPDEVVWKDAGHCR
jgi:hypothetical protein